MTIRCHELRTIMKGRRLPISDINNKCLYPSKGNEPSSSVPPAALAALPPASSLAPEPVSTPLPGASSGFLNSPPNSPPKAIPSPMEPPTPLPMNRWKLSLRMRLPSLAASISWFSPPAPTPRTGP